MIYLPDGRLYRRPNWLQATYSWVLRHSSIVLGVAFFAVSTMQGDCTARRSDHDLIRLDSKLDSVLALQDRWSSSMMLAFAWDKVSAASTGPRRIIAGQHRVGSHSAIAANTLRDSNGEERDLEPPYEPPVKPWRPPVTPGGDRARPAAIRDLVEIFPSDGK